MTGPRQTYLQHQTSKGMTGRLGPGLHKLAWIGCRFVPQKTFLETSRPLMAKKKSDSRVWRLDSGPNLQPVVYRINIFDKSVLQSQAFETHNSSDSPIVNVPEFSWWNFAVPIGFASTIADILDGFLCPSIAAAHRKYNLFDGTMTHFEPMLYVMLRCHWGKGSCPEVDGKGWLIQLENGSCRVVEHSEEWIDLGFLFVFGWCYDVKIGQN